MKIMLGVGYLMFLCLRKIYETKQTWLILQYTLNATGWGCSVSIEIDVKERALGTVVHPLKSKT